MTIASAFLGALFVVIGVLATAVSDRIRGVRWTKERAERVHNPFRELGFTRKSKSSASNDVPTVRETMPVTDAHRAMRGEVISALVQSGFTKPEATAAVDACPSAAQSTLEAWTRAALKQTMIAKASAA